MTRETLTRPTLPPGHPMRALASILDRDKATEGTDEHALAFLGDIGGDRLKQLAAVALSVLDPNDQLDVMIEVFGPYTNEEISR